ncbi:MAG TPA: acyl-CoA dehydrogenase family protein [Acidimicrobiales bacterium]|nr:acyl-CoA dehydrogenase family protein [Acidimicrobiales bacterium]
MTGADPAGFGLAEEVEDLRAAADRFAREVLAPAVRDHERAGRWPDEVAAVVDGFAGGGCLTRAVLLETLATGDAGGLPAADRPGPASGAVDACPDRALAAAAAEACWLHVGDAQTVAWAPGWPARRWVWVSAGDRLALVEVAGGPEPVEALAFGASGGVGIDLGGSAPVGAWDLPPGGGLAVRGRARLWAAAVAVGVGQAAFDATVAYTTERIVFGRPVAHHQANAFDLAALATGLHGARLAVRDAAAGFDDGDPAAGFWATQAWREAVAVAVAVSEAGIQLLGGHGFLVDHLAEKRYREARMLGLLAGGADAALDDLAAAVLDVPDPLLGGVPA